MGFNDTSYIIIIIIICPYCIVYCYLVRMKKVFLLLVAVASCGAEEEAGEAEEATLPTRQEKVFSVFNVVSFPNSACGASSGYNGTCYTSSGQWGTAKVLTSKYGQ